MKEYVITILAIDRVGIIRDVSRAVSDINGNIVNVSQTVMRGYFTLILRVQMPDETPQLAIRQAVERSGAVGEFEVNVRPYTPVNQPDALECQNYMLSISGTDKHGVIARAMETVAQHNINIDDLYAYTSEDKFLMLVHVSVPASTNVESVQSELENLGEEMGFLVQFQHENIFRATNDIIPVHQLRSPTEKRKQ